ncbi:MAG: hypothetical protein LBM20_01030 [Rikenellaceae bacterium]|nr:hypothetical protein [Rikenellaceae bacterium]
MKRFLFIPALIAVLAFSSCATIFTGSKTKVTFDSDIKGRADLTVDGYRVGRVSFPHTMKIKGGFSETIVKAEAEGYEPAMLMINKKFNPVSIINLTDIWGWGLDAITGAMMKPEFKFYEIEFTPEEED